MAVENSEKCLLRKSSAFYKINFQKNRKFDIRLCCATHKGAKSFLMGWGFPGNCRGASTSVQRQTKVPPDKFNPKITSCRKPRPEDLSREKYLQDRRKPDSFYNNFKAYLLASSLCILQ